MPPLADMGLEHFASTQKETYCPLKAWALDVDHKQRLHAQTDLQPCWQKLYFCNHFMHRTTFGFSGWAALLTQARTVLYWQKELSNTQDWALQYRWLKELSPFPFIIKALLRVASSSSCWCQYSSASEKDYCFSKWLTNSLQIFSHLKKGDVLVTSVGQWFWTWDIQS